MSATSHLLNGCKNRSSLQAGDRVRSSFADFKNSPLQCKQCLKSKQFSLLLKREDAAKLEQEITGEWEPLSEAEAEAAEQAILARIRANRK